MARQKPTQRKPIFNTPAPVASPTKLKLRFTQLVPDEQSFSVHEVTDPPPYTSFVVKVEPKDDEEHVATRRSGRATRKPKNFDDDYVMGHEIDQAIHKTAARGQAKSDRYQHEDPDSLRMLLKFEELKIESLTCLAAYELSGRHSSWAPRRNPSESAENKSDEESDGEPSSDTLAAQSPSTLPLESASRLDVHEDVYTVMNSLTSKVEIVVELPSLSNANYPDIEQPYTAKFLVDLYIVCYENQHWNLCDLIVDTWIRAFHVLRKKGQDNSHYQLWRPNACLEKRQRNADAHEKALARKQGRRAHRVKNVGYDDHAPDYMLDIDDPKLDSDMTDFDPELLRNLYLYTKQDCGARLVWADAMALGGDKVEILINRKTSWGQTWHPELLTNIMNSSLRMVRRKLTLKIEEACEGAWCKRYHEHRKYNLPCYREMAWRQQREQEKLGEVEVEVQVEDMDIDAEGESEED